MASTKIYIQDSPITILTIDKEDYISLTDMAHSQLQEHIIFKWMSLKNTIEYLGEWEALYNPNFNYTEFGTIRNMAGSNNFVLSVKHWIERTNAIGIACIQHPYLHAMQACALKFAQEITHCKSMELNPPRKASSGKAQSFIYNSAPIKRLIQQK